MHSVVPASGLHHVPDANPPTPPAPLSQPACEKHAPPPLAGLVLDKRTFLSWTLVLESTVGGRGSESHRLCHREFGLKELSMHADETSSTVLAKPHPGSALTFRATARR